MENEENDVALDSSPEEVAETVSEDAQTPAESVPEKTEKTVPFSRFKEVNDELKKLKEQPKAVEPKNSIDALDFIKLGKKLQDYSEEEIEFATKVAKSKSPDAILEALDDEMVKLAIGSKREKVEKEKLTLRPSAKQAESDAPQSLEEALASARTDAEREEILKDSLGYQIGTPQRADRVVRR